MSKIKFVRGMCDDLSWNAELDICAGCGLDIEPGDFKKEYYDFESEVEIPFCHVCLSCAEQMKTFPGLKDPAHLAQAVSDLEHEIGPREGVRGLSDYEERIFIDSFNRRTARARGENVEE